LLALQPRERDTAAYARCCKKWIAVLASYQPIEFQRVRIDRGGRSARNSARRWSHLLGGAPQFERSAEGPAESLGPTGHRLAHARRAGRRLAPHSPRRRPPPTSGTLRAVA